MTRKNIIKAFITFAISLLCTLSTARNSHAASPEFSFYPDSGYAQINKDFSVDIMIDTKGLETTTAQAVFRFDPDKIEVTDARYGELYCEYPEDEPYVADNVDGWVVLNGFCLDPYYSTESQPELFARFTFVPKVEGDVTIKFVYDGQESDWSTFIMDTGSPPENIMESTPDQATYTIVSQIAPQDEDDATDGKLPGVGLFDNKVLLAGFGLVVLSIIIIVVETVYKIVKKKNESPRTQIV